MNLCINSQKKVSVNEFYNLSADFDEEEFIVGAHLLKDESVKGALQNIDGTNKEIVLKAIAHYYNLKRGSTRDRGTDVIFVVLVNE